MRVIEVEDETPSERWILWTLAGTAVGLTAGVLLAEKFSGRSPDARRFLRRARSIITNASSQWGPLLQMAMDLKDSVAGGGGRPAYAVEEWDEEDEPDDELDASDEAVDDEGEDEDEIGRRVLEAFVNDPVLAERNVEIESDEDGAVVLYGTVRAPREVSHAVTIARGVPGVTQVRQRLSVRRRR